VATYSVTLARLHRTSARFSVFVSGSRVNAGETVDMPVSFILIGFCEMIRT